MCGLVGIASTKILTESDQQLFSTLLLVDTIRGPHSTGVLSVNSKGVNTIKSAMAGYDFITTRRYTQLTASRKGVSSLGNKVLAGHNRYATVGDINAVNAHPFEHGPVTMMHNGTLKSQKPLLNADMFDTDSECIAYNLSQVEPNEVNNVVSKLYGAFALCWYDTRDNSLNFIRNSERPLYLSTDTYHQPSRIMWASEPAMLTFVCDRSNYDYYKKDEHNIFELAEMVHVKLTIDNNTSTYIWSETPCDEYEPPKVTTTYYNTYTYPELDNSNQCVEVGDCLLATLTDYKVTTKNAKGGTFGAVKAIAIVENDTGRIEQVAVTIPAVNKKDYLLFDNDIVIKLRVHVPGYGWYGTIVNDESEQPINGYLMSVPEKVEEGDLVDADGNQVTAYEFLKLTRRGCGWCGSPIFIGDKIEWITEDGLSEPLCEVCRSYRDKLGCSDIA